VIRRVETGDWERLRDVRLRALAADPEAFLETVDTARAFPAEQWRERATPSGDQVTFVAERGDAFDGMVVGFVRGDPATVYLVGMWVAPEFRGSGVAQALVERVLGWAREHGRRRVLLSVEAGNDRAARLYEKCGFVELPEQPEMPYEPNPGNRFFGYEL
jgi:ribosomal protein S18 acetylase RimI-like enzyme